jgi:hypothetical protein
LRVAILVLGTGVVAYMGTQINQLMRFSPFLDDSDNVIGYAGIVVLIWIMALAAVWGAPAIAAALFVVAAAAAFNLGATTFYGDMNVWGGVAIISAVLCAVDWARRTGHTPARYPALQAAQSRAARIGWRVLAVIAGLVEAALLIQLIDLIGT